MSCEVGDIGALKSLLFLKGAIAFLFELSLSGHYLAQWLAQSRHFLFLNNNNELTIMECYHAPGT